MYVFIDVWMGERLENRTDDDEELSWKQFSQEPNSIFYCSIHCIQKFWTEQGSKENSQ